MTAKTLTREVVGISDKAELYIPRESRPINFEGNVQMNIRIPRYLKEQGEEVLALQHVNPSDVVRLLWNYMVTHQQIPACLLQKDDFDEERQRRLKSVEEGAGFYTKVCEQLGLPKKDSQEEGDQQSTYPEMRDQMYEEMLDKYLAL